MNTSPLPSVSVIITTYQRPELALRALRSALAQTYPNKTITVIEDGPETPLRQTIADLGRADVFYLAHQSNRGLAAARNTGINNSNADYVAFLDDDDEWMDTKLAEQVGLAGTAGENCACIYCAAHIVDDAGRVLGENLPKLRGSIRQEIQRIGLHTIPSSCLFSRAALINTGGYDETLRSHIDHDIWMNLARKNYDCDFTSSRLVKAHEHSNERITNNTDARIEATRKFCAKWEPELAQWFGRKHARLHLARFRARVYLMVGLNAFNKGNRLTALKYYCLSLKSDRTNRKCYRNIFRVFSTP
jgi:glycosyltransferase involved in cell wall biosynthesis